MRQYLVLFMEKLNFPEEVKKSFLDINFLFEQNPNYYNEMNLITMKFYSDQGRLQTNEILEELNLLSQKVGIHSYKMHFLFYMYCSKLLLEKYKKSSISEEIFWNSMLDLRCKLFECYNIHSIWGTSAGSWFPRFYTMERFGLGRLQYEYATFAYDNYTRCGFTIHKGDKVYNVHIPSSGPLTRDERMNSYRKAFEFYKNELNGKPLVLVCNSWLLYPKNEMFFPKDSNIIDFMHDFEIIDSTEQDIFADAWRVFGKEFCEPIEKLPVDTSLQRVYVNWLKEGNKTGNGYGVMLFDGECIL